MIAVLYTGSVQVHLNEKLDTLWVEAGHGERGVEDVGGNRGEREDEACSQVYYTAGVLDTYTDLFKRQVLLQWPLFLG